MFVCVFASFRLASLPDMLLYLFFIQTLNLLTSTTTFSNCIPTSYRLPFLRDSRSFVRSCRFTPIHPEFIMCQCICRLNRVFLLTACFSSGLGRCICVHHHWLGNFLPLRLRWATLVPFIYSLAWCICVRVCVRASVSAAFHCYLSTFIFVLDQFHSNLNVHTHTNTLKHRSLQQRRRGLPGIGALGIIQLMFSIRVAWSWISRHFLVLFRSNLYFFRLFQFSVSFALNLLIPFVLFASNSFGLI